MKRILILASLLIAFTTINAKPVIFQVGVDFDYFYTSLDPYGEWIEIDHDVVVWRPSYVRNSWRPYTEGRWTYTNHGWYWDSYEPFGWATYHYGRWYNDDYYGWVWFPDYEWGPSWVEWRYNNDYVGWAPLPPYASFHIDFGIRFSIGWHSRHSYWNFVSYPRFCHRDVNYYIVDNSTNINIYNQTKYRTNYNYRDGRIYNGGIDRNFVERRGGYRVAERNVRTTNDYSSYKRRGNDSDAIVAYRPGEREIQKSRGVEKSNIVRGKSKSSVDVSKIATRSDKSRSTDAVVNRNNDRDVVKKPETGRKSSVETSNRNSSGTRKEVTGKSYKTQNERKENPVSKNSSKRKPVKKESSQRESVKKGSNSKQYNASKTTSYSKPSSDIRKQSVKSKESKKSYSNKSNSSKKKSNMALKNNSSKKSNSKSYKPRTSKKSDAKSFAPKSKQVKKSRSNEKKNSRK